MVRTWCLAAVLLGAILLPSAAAAPSAPVSGKLRWVRGEVTAVSGDALTLKLRDHPLTLSLDGTAPPAVGAIVETHYSDRRGERRLVLIFAADRASGLSKRPGTSYRGVLKQIKRGNLWITGDGKTHGISLERKTRLIDADGSAVATGSKAIAGLLPIGADVVVKEQNDDRFMLIGETLVSTGSDQALEIRRLR
jgi:hypothetical protein